MPDKFNKPFLYILRSLVYLKRAAFWAGRYLWSFLAYLSKIFRQTIGFRLFKLKFKWQKSSGNLSFSFKNHLWALLGKRGFLQILIFIIIFIILVPHTKLYARNTTQIPGRETLLYKIIGPGEQDFPLEEVNMDYTALKTKATDSWRNGSISAQSITLNNNGTIVNQNIASTGAGGSALIKPNIISGGSLTTEPDNSRDAVAIYTVQPGESIGTIADRFGVSITTILWANNLTIRSYIRPGDQLKILPTSGLIHKVKKGDNIAKIAKLYNANAEQIIKANKLQTNGTDIAVGEELIIPGGTKPQTAVAQITTPSTRQYQQLQNIAAPPASSATPSNSGYMWPAGVHRITQYYSWRHTGVDIAGPIGTPLYAAKAGTVIRSQCGWNGGYGCHIIIDHGNGITTLYGHASRLLVSVGDEVEQGQTIGLMGSTGRSTGPHCHFEVRINNKRTNPLQYVR